MRRFGDGSARPGPTAVGALAVCLAATSLHAVLRTQSWYWPSVLAVVVVAGLGLACRWLRLPVWMQPLVSLAGLLVVLTGLYASGPAVAGILPTRGSMRALGTLTSDAVTSLDSLLAPVDPTAQLKVLCVGAVGLMALAVDLIAVGGRRPSYAGIPLVLLVAVPSAIRERSVGYASLLAAAVGFLLLLTLDGSDRTARWGRMLPGSGADRAPAASGTAGPAVRIGAAALLAALLVPFVVPGGHESRFATAGFGGGNGKGGGSTVAVTDPFVSVSQLLNQQSDQILLTVATTTPTYQRLTALQDFTDAGFMLGADVKAPASAKVTRRGTLDGPPRGLTVQAVHDVITSSGAYAEHLLPVPENPTRIDIDGDWRLSAPTTTIFDSTATTQGRQWTVDAAVPAPSPDQLAGAGPDGQPRSAYPAEVQVDLDLPDTLPPVVAQTARAWTAGATSAYDAALDIQRQFTSGAFAYDTTVQFTPGPAGFTDFLDQKRGFCQQFSVTMAAMMRTLGVPARVAIGFTAGTPNAAHDTWTLTGADAHAWPEVWFPGAGWVRFEPTPLGGGRALTPTYAAGDDGTLPQPVAPVTGVPTTAPSASATPSGGSALGKLDRTNTGSSTDPIPGPRPRHHPVRVAVGVAAVLLVVLLLVPLAVDRATRRRRLRPGPSPEAAWEQLLDDAADRLVPVPGSDSPRAAGRRILAAIARSYLADAEVTAAMERMVRAVERSRYAGPSASASAVDLGADERVLRRALSTGLPVAQRTVAAVLPASARARTVAPFTAVGELLLRGLDRVVRLTRRRPATA